jgi:hypothetical protein
MSSGQDNTPGATMDSAQQPADVSTPASPTDNRHPLSIVESIAQQITPPTEGLSESYQSTDTIRRRPEPQSYGMSQRGLLQLSTYFCIHANLMAKVPSYRLRRMRPNTGTANLHKPVTDQYHIVWNHLDHFNH